MQVTPINKFTLKLALLSATVTMLPLPASAFDKEHRMFGKDAPFITDDLPGNSRLRKQLEWLPENTRQQALKRLHKFSFPENDAEHLNVTPEGHIFYSDPSPAVVPAQQSPAAPLMMQAAPQTFLTLPQIDVFKLHSRPNSSKRVFLDFDGMTIQGTQWNIEVNRPTLQAKPFDLDGSPTTFSTVERNGIAEIWHRIAEDYAPFDIDVTTEAPGNFGPTTGHVLFTQDVDASGFSMPANGAGGVAFAEVWGLQNYPSYLSPALVYYNHLGPNTPSLMAEAGAHEFGHNLGLSHDGASSTEYYEGQGSGFVSWAPIMGTSYYKNVTQWSKGEYPNANNKQDDVAIIGSHLGFRPDDHGNGITNASPLLLDSDGSITVSTPEIDPSNAEPDNKGVIESRTDVDWFFFDTDGGDINLTIKPAWAAFYRADNRGANLDIRATLKDGNGAVLMTVDPTNETNTTIATTLVAGRHYLVIEGVGNTITPYYDYNSMGEYFISGKLPNPDKEAPTPNPMAWAMPPTMQTDTNSISMTASTAIDNISPVVRYRFLCKRVGGCTSSSWQLSPSFVVKNIGKGTYSFTVKARDVAGNETALSEEVAVAPSIPVLTDDTASVAEDSFVIIPVYDNDSDIAGSKLSFVRATQGANGRVTRRSGGLQYNPKRNFNGSDTFTYTVTNRRGGIATANVNITVTPVNDAPKAITDRVTVTTNGLIEIQPLLNDIDIDGDTLSIDNVVSPGKKGTAINNGSSISYTAGPSTGSDRLVYTISDGHGGTSKAVIGVRIIKPVITAP